MLWEPSGFWKLALAMALETCLLYGDYLVSETITSSPSEESSRRELSHLGWGSSCLLWQCNELLGLRMSFSTEFRTFLCDFTLSSWSNSFLIMPMFYSGLLFHRLWSLLQTWLQKVPASCSPVNYTTGFSLFQNMICRMHCCSTWHRLIWNTTSGSGTQCPKKMTQDS